MSGLKRVAAGDRRGRGQRRRRVGGAPAKPLMARGPGRERAAGGGTHVAGGGGGRRRCLGDGAQLLLREALSLIKRGAGVEHRVLDEDAHGAKHEGQEQVHVDVVACAVQPPAERATTPWVGARGRAAGGHEAGLGVQGYSEGKRDIMPPPVPITPLATPHTSAPSRPLPTPDPRPTPRPAHLK